MISRFTAAVPRHIAAYAVGVAASATVVGLTAFDGWSAAVEAGADALSLGVDVFLAPVPLGSALSIALAAILWLRRPREEPYTLIEGVHAHLSANRRWVSFRCPEHAAVDLALRRAQERETFPPYDQFTVRPVASASAGEAAIVWWCEGDGGGGHEIEPPAEIKVGELRERALRRLRHR